jgi:prephenate dehydratase
MEIFITFSYCFYTFSLIRFKVIEEQDQKSERTIDYRVVVQFPWLPGSLFERAHHSATHKKVLVTIISRPSDDAFAHYSPTNRLQHFVQDK